MTVPIRTSLAGSALTGAQLADLLGHWSVLDGPLYRLLATRIAHLADTGELPAGVRLPAERQLASAISVSRNTATAAYQLLRDEGLAQTRQGAGTVITPHGNTLAAMHRGSGFFAGLLEPAVVDVDLGLANPDCAPQVAAALDDPRTLLDPGMRRALTGGTGYHLYGLPMLRAAIAQRLTSDHQLPTTPEQILVSTGAQQAIDLLVRTNVIVGQPVLTEDPTFPGPLDVLHRAGARPVSLPVDDGLDPAALVTAVRTQRPALIYLILTNQNPTGRVASVSDRLRIVQLAAETPETLFVDDLTLAELNLTDLQQPPPLAALAPQLSNVVTIGSLSKTYWAGLRVGWIRADTNVLGKLVAAKAAADLGGAGLPQALAASLLTNQHLDIVRWRRRQIRANLSTLQTALHTELPTWSWTEPHGGLSLWVRLNSSSGPCDGGVFSQAALRKGVVVVPGRLLSATDRRRNNIRIAFIRPGKQLSRAVTTLAETWHELHTQRRAEIRIAHRNLPGQAIRL